MRRTDFIDTTKKAIESIKKAIQFLFEELLVVDSKLLPYTNQLVFITDFFNKIKSPTYIQLDKLKNWFWVTTYSGYFTMYSLSKQREAYNQFQRFLKNVEESPVYNDKPDVKFEVSEFPGKLYFGSVRAKALILFMLHHANNFNKIDELKVDGLKLNYLFHNMKDNKGNYFPQGAIVFLNTLQSFPKSKDMSFMFEVDDDYTHYFITKEMKIIFNQKGTDYQQRILEIRKELIVSAEKKFVGNLGIEYPET